MFLKIAASIDIGELPAGMGCEIQAALSATRTRGLDGLPCKHVFVGDLEDLEEAGKGANLFQANAREAQNLCITELAVFCTQEACGDERICRGSCQM